MNIQLFLLSIVLATLCGGSARAQSEGVGEVTFQIGRVLVEREGITRAITRGAKIQVGDILKTSDGGQVHVRFIDGAMLSVRPSSKLQIEEYVFDPRNPEQSSVKFSLVRGGARSISGEASNSAKERFRLNTPFVAIGVRGTDFVTRVEAERVSAFVNQGAIVFAPIDSSCRADTLGPCSGERALLITAEMRTLVEFSRNQIAPNLRPIDVPTPLEMVPSAAFKGVSDPTKRSLSDVSGQSFLSGDLESQLAPVPRPLLWGRWTNMAIYGDVEVVHYLDAIKAHKGAIGTENFSLFRFEPTPLRFDVGSGVHTFKLDQSSVNFVPQNSSTALPASLLRGSLRVDFETGSFGSFLDLLSSTGHRSNLLGIGSVDNRGIFYMDAPDARIRGAVGGSASTAGLTFERSIDGVGKFHGVTLWNK